jgi:hypothetical protein
MVTWTKDLLQAAAKLGLDPENPRHRDLLAKCIDKALAQPPARGRPKGTGTWDDRSLMYFAYGIDLQKKIYSDHGGLVSDECLLDGAFFGGLVSVGINAPDHLAPRASRHISVGTARNLLARGRQLLHQRGIIGPDSSARAHVAAGSKLHDLFPA